MFDNCLKVILFTLNFFLRKTSFIVGDGDLVLNTSGFLSSADIEDTVDIDFECDFNLRLTSGSSGDSSKIEFTEGMVISGHGSFSFEDLNCNCLLVILIGSENLRFLGWEDRSSWDNITHDTTDGFNSQRQRCSIDNDDTVGESLFTTDNTTLNSCTLSDSLIRIDTSVQILAEEILNEFSNLRDTSRTTN